MARDDGPSSPRAIPVGSAAAAAAAAVRGDRDGTESTGRTSSADGASGGGGQTERGGERKVRGYEEGSASEPREPDASAASPPPSPSSRTAAAAAAAVSARQYEVVDGAAVEGATDEAARGAGGRGGRRDDDADATSAATPAAERIESDAHLDPWRRHASTTTTTTTTTTKTSASGTAVDEPSPSPSPSLSRRPERRDGLATSPPRSTADGGSAHAAAAAAAAAVDARIILGVAVVDFNHLVGPQVEYAYPRALLEDEELCANLPFLALPDGSHLSDEDFCYFHLVTPRLSPGTTVFGISCNRQIASELLTVKGKEVTRSTVQKAIVVLAREPVFGPIREKLGVVTRAFFAQGDLGDTAILDDFHATLEAGLRAARRGGGGGGGGGGGSGVATTTTAGGRGGGEGVSGTSTPVETRVGTNKTSSDSASVAAAASAAASISAAEEDEAEREAIMYMGTSLRELIYKWRFKTLMLLKLLLLQRKVMFFGYPIERLCVYQYSLVSLVPGLLLSLQDAGSPTMDTQTSQRRKPESLRMSERKSMLAYLGLPLHLFGEGAFFQPYLPLQQIDTAAKAKSYLVGTSNSIFKQQKDCQIDCVVDLEHTNIEFLDPRLQALVQLTPADRKWMDEVVHVVLETWNAADPSRPTSMQYVGSDDYLRAKFETYVTATLSSLKYADFVAKARTEASLQLADEATPGAAFGLEFLAALRATPALQLWSRTTDAMLFDLFSPKHPCEGKVSTLEDVGLRITAGLQELHLDEQLAPTREALGHALQTGGQRAFQWANRLGHDLARFRREQLSRPESEGGASTNGTAKTDGSGAGSGPNGKRVSTEAAAAPRVAANGVAGVVGGSSAAGGGGGAANVTATTTAAELQAQAAAAAAQAGTQVRAALGSFGSFLQSRQRLWSAAAATAGTTNGGAGGTASSGATSGAGWPGKAKAASTPAGGGTGASTAKPSLAGAPSSSSPSSVRTGGVARPASSEVGESKRAGPGAAAAVVATKATAQRSSSGFEEEDDDEERRRRRGATVGTPTDANAASGTELDAASNASVDPTTTTTSYPPPPSRRS